MGIAGLGIGGQVAPSSNIPDFDCMNTCGTYPVSFLIDCHLHQVFVMINPPNLFTGLSMPYNKAVSLRYEGRKYINGR